MGAACALSGCARQCVSLTPRPSAWRKKTPPRPRKSTTKSEAESTNLLNSLMPVGPDEFLAHVNLCSPASHISCHTASARAWSKCFASSTPAADHPPLGNDERPPRRGAIVHKDMPIYVDTTESRSGPCPSSPFKISRASSSRCSHSLPATATASSSVPPAARHLKPVICS